MSFTFLARGQMTHVLLCAHVLNPVVFPREKGDT